MRCAHLGPGRPHVRNYVLPQQETEYELALLAEASTDAQVETARNPQKGKSNCWIQSEESSSAPIDAQRSRCAICVCLFVPSAWGPGPLVNGGEGCR